jgi:hypothetical protein
MYKVCEAIIKKTNVITNVRDMRVGGTPLMIAVSHGMYICAYAYMIYIYRHVFTFKCIYICIHTYIFTGFTNIAILLLENGAKSFFNNDLGSPVLHVAARLGHIDTMVALIDHGIEVDTRCDSQTTPLHWAAESNQLDRSIYIYMYVYIFIHIYVYIYIYIYIYIYVYIYIYIYVYI